MTLLAIGGAGVIGMQRVTIQGSEDARRYDIAGNIAHEWTSRLQRDAMFWTEPNSTSPNTINISNTRFLRQVGTCFPDWCTPPAAVAPAGLSGSFDIFGRDILSTATDATYCAQYRLQWLADPGVAPALNVTGVMRAEVRVFWKRLDLGNVGDCTAASADANAADATQRYHFVVATTAIRENQPR
jgi:hypothetical protein